MKPKVLPGLTGATLDLLGVSDFYPVHLHVGEVAGIGMVLSHPVAVFWSLPRGNSHLHHHNGAGSAEAPCYCNPLQGLAQYQGSPMPSLHPDLLILYHRSRRGDGRCAARCGTPQCEYGAQGPEEMLGELILGKPLCLGSCSSAQEASGDTRQLPAACRGAGSCLG